MKIICTCILCIGFSYSCFSQETDTLIYQEENWKNEYDSLSALMEKGQFKEALPIADKVIRLANIEYGSNDTTYALSLNKKGEIFSYLGQYEQALSLFFEAKTILIDKSISIDYNYANLLNNIGGVYLATGDYLQAQKYFLQTINIYDKEDEEYNPNYVRALNNLAGTYNEMGYLHKAEPLFKRVVEIRKIIFTENHPRYAFSLDNLGLLYRKIGRYSEAEKLFLEAAEILASELGNKHPWYAISLKERAALYQTMGRFYEAQELYDQVITIFKEKLGNEHPLLARSLNDYGVLCTTIGDTPKAHESLVEASKIFRLKFGKNSEYSTTTFNLANLCVIMGRFKEAETLYLEALKIDNEQLGADHPSYATSLNKLADLYRFQENYDEAEKMYLQAKEIRKEQLGEEHPDYATSLHNLALLYQAMGRYGETEPHMRQASDILVANLELNFGGLSEKEKEQYLQTVKRSFEVYYSFALQRKATNPAVTTMSYDNVLVNKGLLLASSQQIRRAILNSQDTSLLATYNEFVDLKQQLATLYSRPIDQRYTSTDSLEQLANRLERALSAGSAEFQVQQQAFQVRWQDVQSSLQEGEAAVEFINFSYRNEKAWTDTTYYAALVLRPDDEHPQLVQLCTQAHLDSLLSGKNNETLADVLYIDYANDSSQMLRDLSGEAHQLYRLIWQPLDSLLSAVERLYYAPSGRLHQINLDAVLHPEGDRLMDRYALVRLSSTRSLALPKAPALATNSFPATAALFGGIRYGSDSASSQEQPSPAYHNQVAALPADTPTTRSLTDLSYLPATEKEVTDIKYYLQPPQWDTHVYSDYQATEQQFSQLGTLDNTPSPTIVHLATHGFFYEDVMDTTQKNTTQLMDDQLPAYRLAEDPLLRAGLMLSYAQQAWKGDSIPDWQKEDGILTAYEIAQQDLSHTELVVLSACETGLGDIRGSEGVYGLQRAFKMAGVDYLMMSLWKVPDAPTRQMMNYFYYHLIKEQMSVREAFRKAQQQMIEDNYPPYAWAAFVLLQ